MSDIKTILGPMRIPFLILTPVCVTLGLGVAVWSTGNINFFHFILALIGAILAHISVNTLNEYVDFKSGLDFKTTSTLFSGGSGILPARPEKAHFVLVIGLAASVFTMLIGLYFLCTTGLSLLPIGVAGLLIIFTYTIWLNRNPVLCLIAPGLGFGPLMVMGTGFVLAGRYTWSAFFASLAPFFLVSNLLLINQFPDVEADRSVGRRNISIVAGRQTSVFIYIIFLLAAYLSIVISTYLGYLPLYALLGIGSVIIAVPTAIGILRNANDTNRLLPFMGLNVLITLVTPLLVSIGLLIG